MKKLTMALSLGFGCALAAGAAADEKTAKMHSEHGANLTATGCLQKGEDANAYQLTQVAGGHDWELVGAPATLKLSEHVGHKVEVSGRALQPGEKVADEKGISSGTGSGATAPVEKNPPPEDRGISSGTGSGTAKMKGKKGEYRLKVASLKMVAGSCP
jgi:hypothetical protein